MTTVPATFLPLLSVLYAFYATAADFKLPPRPNGRVLDEVRLLQPEQIRKIEQRLSFVSKNKQAELVVLITDRLKDPTNGYTSIEDFANKVFELWGVGSKLTNRGALLVVSVGSREMRIEVGYGLEALIPDAVAKRIIAEDITPYFRRSQYYSGLMSFILAVERCLDSIESHSVNDEIKRRSGVIVFQLVVIGLLVGLIMLLGGVKPRIRMISSRGTINDPLGRWRWDTWGSNAGDGSFGGGFGGGSSGGGGASGRW